MAKDTLQSEGGPGFIVFAGNGAWLRRSSEALILKDPARVLATRSAAEVPALLEEVDAEQKRGRYAAGFLSYEAGAAFGFTVLPSAPEALPLAWFAVYEPDSVTSMLPEAWQELLDGVEVQTVAQALAESTVSLNVSREEYTEAITRVREYIAAGDTYQVNYTVRGRFDLGNGNIHPLHYFLALVVRQPVPYAAYLDLGDTQVLSLSPEMFLRREDCLLVSRPMKGTRPRGSSHVEDVALAHELVESEKERAENLMITDMVRNDLGRVCRAGSVRVPTLYVAEPYRTVWQMVSTVTGEVNPRASLKDIMQAVFPGASITGAPKHHTMEIIAELETEPRDVYTGAIGLFLPGGDFTCSIAIRTIVHRQGRCQLGTGSGVVWDAAADSEYQETLTKAAFATPPVGAPWRPNSAARLREESFQLFETILLEAPSEESLLDDENPFPSVRPGLFMGNKGVKARYRYLDKHLDRMAASAEALGFPFDREKALALLIGHGRLIVEPEVVRLNLARDGSLSLTIRPVPSVTPPVTLLVSPFRTDPDDPLLRHKTSARGFYDRENIRAVIEGYFDALFLNRLGRVTEGAITNIFARFGDQWVTPPLSDGLLPGIWRAEFLAQTGAEEASLFLDDLLRADEVVVGNSVRGQMPVARLVTDPVAYY